MFLFASHLNLLVDLLFPRIAENLGTRKDFGEGMFVFPGPSRSRLL